MNRSRSSRIRERIHDYVAGDLDPQEALDLERMLAGDPALRGLLEEIRDAHDALTLLRHRPEPPVRAEDALPRIRARIAAERFAPRPRLYLQSPMTRVYRAAALAATFLLAVTVGFFAVRRPPSPPDSPALTVAAPPPAEGRLPRLVEAGMRGGMSAAQLLRMLDEAGLDAAEFPVFRGNGTVLPVAFPPSERR
jgi:anti-sigma factor RsiW